MLIYHNLGISHIDIKRVSNKESNRSGSTIFTYFSSAYALCGSTNIGLAEEHRQVVQHISDLKSLGKPLGP